MSSNIGNIGSYDPTALYESLFKKIDSNSDGGIDKTEFTSALSDMASDQNVSEDEAAKMFTALDTDGDGKIDAKEMMKALKNAGEQAQASMPPPPPTQSANGSSASSSTSANGVISEQNSLFSDLINSLSSSSTSKSDESDLFSSLIESLKSSTTSSDDQITSIFNSLIQEMQNSAQYSQTGNVSYTTGSTTSLLSEYA